MRKLIAGVAVVCAACSVFGSSSDPSAPPPGDDAGTDSGTITGVPGTADFTLSVPPDRTWLVQGSTVDVTVTAQRGALLTDAIDVTLAGLPMGVMPATIIIPPMATSAKLTLQATSDAPQGPATVTLSGVSGKATSMATLNLFVRGKPGSIDTTFGTGGTTALTYPGVTIASCGGLMLGLHVDANDRVYALAFGNSSDYATCYRRLTPDGQPDSSYQVGATPVVVSITGSYLDSSGRLLFAGSEGAVGSPPLSVARLDATGAPDSTFGTAGIARYTPPSGTARAANAITERADGVVVVGFGYKYASTTWDSGILELTSTGSVRTAFGASGVTSGNWSLTDDAICGIFVRPSNAVFVPGAAQDSYGAVQSTAETGLYDSSIGAPGTPGRVSAAFAVQCGGAGVLLPDGGYIFSLKGSPPGIGLHKIKADGSADATFGANGYVQLVGAGAVLRDSNGNLVVSTQSRAITRMSAGGVVDTGFGSAGVLALPGTGSLIALQSDGRILSGGTLTDNSLAITRIWN